MLIDIDRDILLSDAINVFYVGSSRARFRLNLVAGLTTDECHEILERYEKSVSQKPEKALATFLNAKYIKDNCVVE